MLANDSDRSGQLTAGAAALELRNVSVMYPDGHAPLHEVNLCLEPGEIVALLGASGSGKSTLLRAIAGLEPLAAGEIWMRGTRIDQQPVHQRSCGMVFQDGQLFPFRSVGRNIAYGLESQRLTAAERDARVTELLELVGLSGYADRSVQTLSGGQAQRIALARSLAPRPQVLLLDEPLSALDRDLREQLAGQLREVLQATNTTALFVTHDAEEASRVADRTLRIRNRQLAPVAE
ncbi:ABC transporter ATP-binding protein [Gulosibacter bifidus]|uniref:ABC transporter ATP-binding protein n=1 Tax=Gulosibacter bifidus TaxID=272239 RepID=A0ABW5RJT1_9MICO|nr:ABC transporter ATP-binding protein [Gulosibacter bifidus]